MPLKVLITTNIPSPYFVDYANELTKYVDLTVIFELNAASDRNKDWQRSPSTFKFKYIFLNARKFNNESGLSFKVKKYLKDKSFNRIIIANPTTPTGIVALLYLRKHHIPFIIQSEGGFKGTGKGLKEKFKKRLMEKADFYLTGMGDETDYFMAYGGTIDRLKRYNFTSLYNKEIINKPINKDQKLMIRKLLGLDYQNMILYVGQFIDRKDIPTLLKSFMGFDNKTCLVLVGGESTSEYKTIERDLKLNNVFYIPFKSKEETNKYYQAADLLILPTKEDTWGLVINEAMANALPVISTNKSIAARQLINNGENGFIVNERDFSSINKYAKELLNDNNLINSIALNNLKKISDYTIENMALAIYNHIK